MSAEVIDYTLHALRRLSARSLESGNPFESYCLEELIKGYEDGLWEVEWERGEPLFNALITAEERERYNLKKDQ